MPRVPEYNLPQAQPQELPGVQQSTPMRLLQKAEIGPGEQARLGQQIEGAGRELGDIAIQQQADINEATIKQKTADVMNGINTILRDPKTGYLNQVGADAVKGYSSASQAIQDTLKTAGEDLQNPKQQQMWMQVSNQLGLQALNEIRTHAGNQTRVYNGEQSNALYAASVQSMVGSSPTWNIDGSPFKMYEATARQQAIEAAHLKFGDNADPVLVDQAVKNSMTAAHAQVIGDLISRNMAGSAKDYLNNLDPADVDNTQMDKLRKLVNENATLQQAQSSSDAIYAKYAGDEKSALEQVRAIQDPEVRQKTQVLVEERFNTDKRIQDDLQRNSDNQGATMYANGKTLSQIMQSPVWQTMSGHAQRQVEEWARADSDRSRRLSQEDKMAEKMSDLVGLQQIMQLRQNDPDTFSKMDVVKTASNLGIKNPSIVKQVIDMQGSFNKQDAAESALNTAFKNARAIYQPLLVSTGITPKPGLTGNAKETALQNVAAFETKVQSDIQEWAQQHQGKMPQYNDLKTIVNQNLTPMSIRDSGGWFSSDKQKFNYQLTPDETSKAYVVSAKDLQKQSPAQYERLYNNLKGSLGRAPSTTEIENAYSQLYLQQKGK